MYKWMSVMLGTALLAGMDCPEAEQLGEVESRDTPTAEFDVSAPDVDTERPESSEDTDAD